MKYFYTLHEGAAFFPAETGLSVERFQCLINQKFYTVEPCDGVLCDCKVMVFLTRPGWHSLLLPNDQRFDAVSQEWQNVPGRYEEVAAYLATHPFLHHRIDSALRGN